MNINIPIAACLNFFRGHEKFLIKLLVQLVKYQASLCGNQRGICVGIFLVADIHDGLTFFIHIIQHPHKVLFVITIIPVAFRHYGLHLFQSALHNIMHDRNGNFGCVQFVYLINYILANQAFFFAGKFRQCSVCAFSYRIDHFLHVKGFPAAVLFDDAHIYRREKLLPIIDVFGNCLFKITAHVPIPFKFLPNEHMTPTTCVKKRLHYFLALKILSNSLQTQR